MPHRHKKVIIADDHSIVRLGLVMMLQELGCKDVVEVSSCKELLSSLTKDDYDYLILDLIMGDGNAMEIIPVIQLSHPNLSILVHSMQPESVYGKLMKRYGAVAYLSKTASEIELKQKLVHFLSGESLDEPEVAVRYTANPFSQLSVRELEVLHYLLNGHGTKQMSGVLGIKMNTISTIKAVIFQKLKVETIPQLLQLADIHQINY